jgi:hypothetical protein
MIPARGITNCESAKEGAHVSFINSFVFFGIHLLNLHLRTDGVQEKC